MMLKNDMILLIMIKIDNISLPLGMNKKGPGLNKCIIKFNK